MWGVCLQACLSKLIICTNINGGKFSKNIIIIMSFSKCKHNSVKHALSTLIVDVMILDLCLCNNSIYS